MFDPSELDQLMDAMRAHGVTTLAIKTKGELLRLVLPAAASAIPPLAGSRQVPIAAKSPGIGTFLPRGSDDGLAPLSAGIGVGEGDVLGYVCQGPVRVPIVAPTTGFLTGGVPEDGAILGYGDIAFNVDPKR